MAKSIAKRNVSSKFNVDQLSEQPLFATNPEAVLPLLSMLGQAQLSIEDLLGQLSRQFIEQMLVLSAQGVAGAHHKGRHTGEVRWHGTQNGVVAVGHSKLRVKRPRLRGASGEVGVPAYNALATDGDLSRRIADILVCNVSTRKYARVVHRCADELGISKTPYQLIWIQVRRIAGQEVQGQFATCTGDVFLNDGLLVRGQAINHQSYRLFAAVHHLLEQFDKQFSCQPALVGGEPKGSLGTYSQMPR
jgi:hypothetical protein